MVLLNQSIWRYLKQFKTTFLTVFPFCTLQTVWRPVPSHSPLQIISTSLNIRLHTNRFAFQTDLHATMVLSLSKLFAVLATISIFFSCASKAFARSIPENENDVRISSQHRERKTFHKKWDFISYCNHCFSTPAERRSCIEDRAHCSKKIKAPYSLLKKDGLSTLLGFARRSYHGSLFCEGVQVLEKRMSNPCLFPSGDMSMIYISAFEAEMIRALMRARVDVEQKLESVREYVPRYRHAHKNISERTIAANGTVIQSDLVDDDDNDTTGGGNGPYLLPIVSEFRFRGKYSQHRKVIESIFNRLRRQDGFTNGRTTFRRSRDGETLIVQFHFLKRHVREFRWAIQRYRLLLWAVLKWLVEFFAIEMILSRPAFCF